MNRRAKVAGNPGLSFRDEPWEVASDELAKAYQAGYHFSLVDDGFILFPAMPQNIENIQYHDSLEDLFNYARKSWWVD